MCLCIRGGRGAFRVCVCVCVCVSPESLPRSFCVSLNIIKNNGCYISREDYPAWTVHCKRRATSEKDAEQRARGIIQQFLRHTQSTSHQDAYMSEHGAKWTKPDSSQTMYVSIVALMSLPRFEHVSTTFDVVTREDGIESTCFKCSSIIKCNTSGPIRFCMNMEQHAR